MLFEVTRPGIEKVSFLFGTMHTASENAYTFYNAANKALDMVNAFAAEIDFSDPAINEMQTLFTIPNHKTLHHYFSEKKYSKIRKQLKKSFQVDLNHFVNMQPMFTLNQIMVSLIDAGHPQPLDHQLYRDALQLHKDILGLETMEEQYNIVNQLDMETQIQQFKKLTSKPEKVRKKMMLLDNLYRKGDIKALYHHGRHSLGAYRKVLLKDRNINMAHRMDLIMENQSLFSAVGVAHLYGKNGMIKLLKQKGYTVKKSSFLKA
jgi:uncharacterized protein YbaP (TraB family)